MGESHACPIFTMSCGFLPACCRLSLHWTAYARPFDIINCIICASPRHTRTCACGGVHLCVRAHVRVCVCGSSLVYHFLYLQTTRPLLKFDGRVILFSLSLPGPPNPFNQQQVDAMQDKWEEKQLKMQETIQYLEGRVAQLERRDAARGSAVSFQSTVPFPPSPIADRPEATDAAAGSRASNASRFFSSSSSSKPSKTSVTVRVHDV